MDKMMKSALRIMVYLMSACLILWAIIPEWKPIMLGLMVGLAASSFNAIMMKRRVGLITEAATTEGSKRRGLGFGNRIATVLLVAMIAYRYPETLNMPAALSGSMVMPFVLLAVAIVHTMKENSNGKG
ncbi:MULTISPECIES: ATP synthase subunit I [unclassified Paenibacillus]|uniref:ATP synthase subunit I n=1 Tax=unclassified Paenibacillus TaxID=185978 RepID=UPI002F3F9D21